MTNPRSNLRIVWVLAGLAVAAAAGGVIFYQHKHTDVLPALSLPDIQEQSRQAAHVERIHGRVVIRPATPEDDESATQPSTLPSPVAQATSQSWENLAQGASIKLGTLIKADAKSGVEFSTAGQWYMSLDGDGALVLQDARRNAEGTEHIFSVYVQQGTFKAKAAYGEGKGYYLDVATAAARIHVYEGEFGMEVGAHGKGRMWLMSGRAVAVWNDGRRKELGLRGLEDL